MSERFVRIGVEIPLSLYANLDKIKNGSAASGRILEVIKKEKTEMEKARKEFDLWKTTKTYKNSIYGEMDDNDNRRCDNCMYYRSIYGYGQCYAQKNAPRINDNYSCENFRPKEEV